MMDLNLAPIVVIIIAIVAIGFVWKVITGVIRLVLTLGILAVGAYFLYMYLA